MKARTRFLWFTPLAVLLVSIELFHLIYYKRLGDNAIAIFLTVIGFVCNLLVVYYNDWKMPVYVKDNKLGKSLLNTLKSENHFIVRDKKKARLLWLSDRMHIKITYLYKGYLHKHHLLYSIGDILLLSGVLLSITRAILILT